MGAEFNYVVIKDLDNGELKNAWTRMVEKDLYENGHSYSGSIGMLGRSFVKVQKQRDVDSAVRYIEEHHQKWESAMCVPFPGGYVIGGWCSS